MAGVLAVPGALWIVYGRSNLRAVLLAVYGAGLGLPPVAVGLAVAFVFWRSGPLGFVDWLYTPGAMCLAQTIIVLPLIGTLAVVALRGGDAELALQLSALGIPRRMRLVLLPREVAPGLAAAMLAGFGRAIAEVGAAQMTGGNIEGQTRVLTTATMLAVRERPIRRGVRTRRRAIGYRGRGHGSGPRAAAPLGVSARALVAQRGTF